MTNPTRYTLRSDQLHEVPAYDEVEYWKSRATKAEEKLRGYQP